MQPADKKLNTNSVMNIAVVRNIAAMMLAALGWVGWVELQKLNPG